MKKFDKEQSQYLKELLSSISSTIGVRTAKLKIDEETEKGTAFTIGELFVVLKGLQLPMNTKVHLYDYGESTREVRKTRGLVIVHSDKKQVILD